MSSEKNQDWAMFTPPSDSAIESISDSIHSADSGYFGAASFTCHRCSVSSTTSTSSARSDLPARSITEPTRVSTFVSQHPPPKLDAMQRTYPEPTAELTIGELINLPPTRRSMRDCIKNARDIKAPAPPSKEEKARAFEEMKKVLLLSHAQLNKPQASASSGSQ